MNQVLHPALSSTASKQRIALQSGDFWFNHHVAYIVTPLGCAWRNPWVCCHGQARRVATARCSYLATKLRAPCALKMLLKGNIRSDIQAERVLSGAQALTEVNHPYIVALHGAFQDETHIFFVLEYVGCGDLYTRLQDGPLADESGRLVLAEVALAIQHVHECGYMYRDLKSENVLLCIDGHIKLADFGLAKKVADKRQEIELRAADGQVRKTRHPGARGLGQRHSSSRRLRLRG